MRPDGIGRPGWLIRSTSRSNQSLIACDAPHISGPASTMPSSATGQARRSGTPDETTPQPKAHIGANQVIGFSSSTTVRGAIRAATWGATGGAASGAIWGAIWGASAAVLMSRRPRPC